MSLVSTWVESKSGLWYKNPVIRGLIGRAEPWPPSRIHRYQKYRPAEPDLQSGRTSSEHPSSQIRACGGGVPKTVGSLTIRLEGRSDALY